MNLTEAIETLEAEGFHLYRKNIKEGDLLTALLVLPALDLYADVHLSGDDSLVTFTGGKLGEEEIVITADDDLRRQIWGVLYKAKDHGMWHEKDEEESDMILLDELAELEKETGRTFDRVWQGSSDYFKLVYRGVVIEINNELEVLSVYGAELNSDDDPDSVQPPLIVMLRFIDQGGGLEERTLTEEELEA